jgi:hypothetical protein
VSVFYELKQLKSTLLSSGFNECILLFSDLPDIVNDVYETPNQITDKHQTKNKMVKQEENSGGETIHLTEDNHIR